jgi:hypothetical protein
MLNSLFKSDFLNWIKYQACVQRDIQIEIIFGPNLNNYPTFHFVSQRNAYQTYQIHAEFHLAPRPI